MKHVFNTSAEVAHLWAHQTQDNARCRNASFDGFKYYSYSTVIAEIRRNDRGEELVLLCVRNYSSTTTTHKYEVRRAVNHMNLIEVNHVRAILSDHDINYRDFLDRYESLMDLASRARQRKDMYLRDAASIVADMDSYAKFFSLEWALPTSLENATELKANYAAEQDRLDRERRAKREADQAENLALWLAGGDSRSFDALKLRIKDGEIQTSHGANIPIDHALKVWPAIHRAHILGRTFVPSQERAIHLGHYRFNSFENDVLIVGCHRIPYTEIERMAQQLGLLEEVCTS